MRAEEPSNRRLLLETRFTIAIMPMTDAPNSFTATSNQRMVKSVQLVAHLKTVRETSVFSEGYTKSLR